jgi:hypothetical protein
VLKHLNVVKIQSAKTGIRKLLVSARMVTSLSRETLPTVKVSRVFDEVTCENLAEKRVLGFYKKQNNKHGRPFSWFIQAA